MNNFGGTPNFSSAEQERVRIAARNQWLESVMDPEGTLPKVHVGLLDVNLRPCDTVLPITDGSGGNSGSIFFYIPEDEDPIADLVLGQNPDFDRKLIVTDSSVREDKWNEGYGVRLYLEAMKALPLGYDLICHSMLSPDARNAWERLVDLGLARQTDEFRSGQSGEFVTVLQDF